MSDILGVSAADVALVDSQIIGNISNFLSEFFGSDALPTTLVMAPSGVDQSEIDKLESWFKKKMRQVKGVAERVIGLKGEIKIETLTPELKTFEFDKLDSHAVQGVSDAFEIPQSLLRSQSGANRAISDNDRRSFVNDTIVPRCKYYERMLNPVLEEENQRIEFAPEEMSEMQADEADRSEALKNLVDSGVPLDAALDILGYDLSADAQKILKKYLTEKEARRNAIPIQPTPIVEPIPNSTLTKSDLDRWMRKALSKFRSDGSAKAEFESDALPVYLKAGISALLETARSEEQVKNIFRETIQHYAGNGSR
jgi:hypothetical protein